MYRREREESLSMNAVFERNATVDDVTASLAEVGYAVVEKLADPDTLARVNEDFDPYLGNVKLGETEFAGFKTRRINNLIAKSAACGQLALNPLVMSVCDRVLLPYCVRYHLHVTTVIELQPGERAQGLHRDGGIYPVRFPSIPMTLATIWALSDFTPDNGGTSVVPGSHRWPDEREPRPEEVISTVMPAGSVLIYTSNFIHGSGDNRSNAIRRGMALHYNLGWLRQEENQYLSLPPAVAKKLPVELQKLVGYDFGAPYLGFVEEGNPRALLEDGENRDMARTSPEAEAARARIKPIPVGEGLNQEF
jgi:ectoine hydroxylase-related dioxygenase (phytanoyl-CoA dioxygenase family)